MNKKDGSKVVYRYCVPTTENKPSAKCKEVKQVTKGNSKINVTKQVK